MLVETILILIHNSSESSIVLCDTQLPRKPIDQNLYSTASNLLLQITGIEAKKGTVGWLQLHFAGVVDDDQRNEVISTLNPVVVRRILSTVYIGVLDEKVPLTTGYQWRSLADILKHDLYMDHKDIIIKIFSNNSWLYGKNLF